MRIKFVALLALGLLVAVVVGCSDGGDSGPELVPVSGTVTLDGKPLSGTTVNFVPTGSTLGGNCYGVTDASGRYELMVDEDHKGAAVGEYKVTCSKWVLPDGSDFVGTEGGPSPMEAEATEAIPEKYRDEATTDLEGSVPAGGTTIDFKLTSK